MLVRGKTNWHWVDVNSINIPNFQLLVYIHLCLCNCIFHKSCYAFYRFRLNCLILNRCVLFCHVYHVRALDRLFSNCHNT